jgi:hypothetical protein
MQLGFSPKVLKYYPLLVQPDRCPNRMLCYSQRYVRLQKRLGETLVADLSRCEET